MCNECKFIWQHQSSQDTNPLLSNTTAVSSVAQVLAPDLVGPPPNPQQSQGKKHLIVSFVIMVPIHDLAHYLLPFVETDAFWADNDSDSNFATQDFDQLLRLLGLGDDRPVPEPVSWRESDPLGSSSVPVVVSLGN